MYSSLILICPQQSRWALVCVLCRERRGACIQCSVKTCKTAYHVTCAFKHGLEMKAIIEDESADDGVKLRVRYNLRYQIYDAIDTLVATYSFKLSCKVDQL